MKNSAVIIFLILFSLTTFAQNPRTAKRPAAAKTNAAKTGVVSEKAAFEKALATENVAERVAALEKFNIDFPKSNERIRALELLVSGRAGLADAKMRAGDAQNSIELFKLAVANAPQPVSDKLFIEVLLQIPTSVFFHGQTAAAIELARLVEEKAAENARQTIAIAGFYLAMENAAEAKRLAEKSLLLEPNLPGAYQTLGIAHRLNFQLEESAVAYAKALELDPNSNISKRNLAEMRRALGKPSEAAELYNEILDKDASDEAAWTGLILALFDAGKRSEAQEELQKALGENPDNLPLLVGAAYWYAANSEPAKAVELAEKAITVEPRYTWAYIALARGLLQQKRPADAERALLTARNYGNFPTLDYELASVRLSAGFYREAADELKKSFAVSDGLIETRLGGRVPKEGKTFIELLALERRASIFQPLAADNPENAGRLKALLDFVQKLEFSNNDAAIAAAAEDFVKGGDNVKLHRQLFAASRLLEKRKNLSQVMELARAAIGGVDAALDAPNPVSSVLADELYDSRRLAISKGEIVIVPEVPRRTLSNILRGRIEEITGWALFQTEKKPEAVVRLKRAVSVLPENSAWWRSAMWRLGTALEADGKSKEALETYIKTYTSTEPDAAKHIVIESLYQKVNGNLDGLEARIGAKPSFNFPVQQEEVASREADKTAQTAELTTDEKTNSEIETETSPVEETNLIPKVSNENAETSNKEKNAPIAAVKNTEEATKPKVIIEDNVLKRDEKAKENTVTSEIKPQAPLKNQNTANTSKSLFEPIIITVPEREGAKKTKAEINRTETNAQSDGEGNLRPRRVERNEETPPVPCWITVNQENITLLRSGGSLGLLVGVDEPGDVKQITATSSSPKDIEVVLEPEIGSQSNRAFFVVKSISSNVGVFTVIFESTCGKREILVKVR